MASVWGYFKVMLVSMSVSILLSASVLIYINVRIWKYVRNRKRQ